jgi:ABC-type multidrug transport system ATPase subunit
VADNDIPLEARGISKNFGELKAVKDLSLKVYEGDIYGFIGPNGAGKTTSIRMMLGLISASAGTARIFGHDIRRSFLEAISRVGAMVEGPAFYPYLSGIKNLEIYGALTGGASRSRIYEVLDMVGLGRRGKDKVKGYSQGMRQRLGIAQALLHRPALLVLDEPTNGLDPQGMREVRNLIRRISQQERTTIFLSSHLLGEMEMVCNRIGIIHRGEIIKEGMVDDLLGHKADRVVLHVDREKDAQRLLRENYPGVEIEITKAGWLEFPRKDLDTSRINFLLVEKGFAVYSLAPRRRSLEEYFVELTGESQDVY